MTGLIGMPKLKSKKLSSFFNTVRQAIFHFKPNGFDCRKADKTKKHRREPAIEQVPFKLC